MKKTLLLFFLITLLSGCRNNGVFTVNGTVKKTVKNYIYVSRIDINIPVLIDSSKINRKGNFRIKIKAREPDFYAVGCSSSDFIILLAEPGEKIELSFNGETFYNNYTVTGSKGSELVQKLDFKLLETKNKLDSLYSLYNKVTKEPDFELKAPRLEEEYLKLIKDQRKYNIEFILKNMNSLASIRALFQKLNDQTYVLYDPRVQYLKIVSDSLLRHYPDSKHTKALVNDFEKEMFQFNARRLQQLSATLPEAKLDPDLKDINGKRIILSSLKGKYVLLAFWSAASDPCISENLQLKKYYKMFNKRGFEIYQINLDKDETVWKDEVKYDELPWISTREENPDDQKYAKLFNVTTLPANFLFDRNGNIIASHLHGKNLQLKLNQLFNN
ncbi:MAG: TlpA disulfide reductase family protein [Bacteroidia bacterium]|nr:TlpA disulfide reductase family protein [Bacteroidia bacterium]